DCAADRSVHCQAGGRRRGVENRVGRHRGEVGEEDVVPAGQAARIDAAGADVQIVGAADRRRVDKAWAGEGTVRPAVYDDRAVDDDAVAVDDIAVGVAQSDGKIVQVARECG